MRENSMKMELLLVTCHFLDMQVDAAILVLDLFIQKVQLFSSYIIEEVHNIGSSANVVMERKEVVGGLKKA